MDAKTAIETRRSVRGFLDRPVRDEDLREILRLASRSPSGGNAQPWKVYVARGEALRRVCDAAAEAFWATWEKKPGSERFAEAFPYYPESWRSPYSDRRRQNGMELYRLVGVERGDRAARGRQAAKNFRMFGAPVGLFLTVADWMGDGAKMDCAMFAQTLMLAARSMGIDSCPHAAFNKYASVALPALGAPKGEILVCAVALGYEDPDEPANALRAPRAGVDEFTVWLG